MRKVTVLKSFTGTDLKGSKGQVMEIDDEVAVSLEGCGIVSIMDEPLPAKAKADPKPAPAVKGKKK